MILCWRGAENRSRRDAEGVERGGDWGSRLGGLRERRKFPQRGPSLRGGAPAKNGVWCILSLKKTNLVMTNLIFFCHFIAHI